MWGQTERAEGAGGDWRGTKHLAELQGAASVILPETRGAKGKGGGESGRMPSSIQAGVHLYVWIGHFIVARKLRRELQEKSGK